MGEELKDALEAYVRACGGDPKNLHTESMEQRVAREKMLEFCVDPDNQESPGCDNCPCSNCNAL